MSAGDYLEGAVLFVAIIGPTLAGALVLLRRRFPQLVGADGAVAYGVLATAGVLAVHMLPLTLGVLTRGTAVLAAGVWLAACLLVRPVAVESPPPRRPARAAAGDGLANLLALIAVAAAAVFSVAFALDQLVAASASIDFQNFHLPSVATWIQAGSLWHIDAFLPDVAPGNYPNNGDVILLAAVLPWHNDFLSHLSIWPFVPLTGLAAYALARELGAPKSAAAVTGCLLVTIPAVAVPAFANAMVDAVMLFPFAAGVLFLLRHARTGTSAELVLAGLALGISFGTKWYAVSSVAIVVVVWALASLLVRRDLRLVLRQSAVVIGLVVLAGGIWLLRNWIESGNPFFPVKVAPLGVTIFDAPPDFVRELGGFTIAGYVGDTDAWTEFILPQYKRALAGPAVLIGAAFMVAALLLLRGRPKAERRTALLACAVAAGLIAVAYSITPYTAGGPEGSPVLVGADSRYLIPALVVAAPLAAWAAGAFRLGPAVFGALGLLAIAHGIRWASHGGLSGASVDGKYFAAGTAIVAGVAAGVWLLARARRDPRSAPALGRVGFGLAAAAAVVALVGGHEMQQRFNDHRYRGGDPVVEWVVEMAGFDQRIGLAGLWSDAGVSPVLPAFGPRLDNEVDYVGPIVREMRRRYTTRVEFVAALERGDFDYLVVGRGRPAVAHPREDEWARSAGYALIARSDRLDLYEAPS